MQFYSNAYIQVLALTTDNASNNITLVDELADLLNGFQGSLAWIRCFAHVLNLVVKVYENLRTFLFADISPRLFYHNSVTRKRLPIVLPTMLKVTRLSRNSKMKMAKNMRRMR